MRLICPSCGAQYEVDESVIPETGRDVQCSNCGHAWFQPSAAQMRRDEEAIAARAATETAPDATEPDEEPADIVEAEAPDEAEPPAEVPDGDEGETEAGPESEAPDVPEPAVTAEKEQPVEEADTADDESAAVSVADPEPVAEPEEDQDALSFAGKPRFKRRKLDDSVLDVLREEADRETRVRKVEETLIESQPDLGLAAVAAAEAGADAMRDRVVRVRGDEDDLDDDALVSRGSRRELLPDIEEIKSTLRATSERGNEPASIDAPETVARRQRSGFRSGFSVAVLIALILVILYLLAPTISDAVPALEPALTGYTGAVDAARVWLDVQLQSLTAALQGA